MKRQSKLYLGRELQQLRFQDTHVNTVLLMQFALILTLQDIANGSDYTKGVEAKGLLSVFQVFKPGVHRPKASTRLVS